MDLVALSALTAAAVRLATPIGFAALGGVIAERSGVYNVALEGMMLFGAFGAAAGSLATGSPVVGCLAGIAVGMLGGLLLGVLAITFRVNQLVAGIALNLAFAGLTAFLARAMLTPNTSVTGFGPLVVSPFSELPVLGEGLFRQDPLVYLLIFLTALVTFILYRTHAGLALRATGEYPRAADTAGINVTVMRCAAMAISGGLAALGGCQLVLSQVYVFSEGMSAGKGFIALAAIILGRWNPVGAVAAAFLFGFCDAVQLRLQFSNPEIPYQIFLILPYAVSLVTMVWFLGKSKQPAAAGRIYDRESR